VLVELQAELGELQQRLGASSAAALDRDSLLEALNSLQTKARLSDTRLRLTPRLSRLYPPFSWLR